ncbi:acetyltransferase (GNAT) family protein [Sphaerotilus hippei]|uniref:Acetyltransferase (GNAT) family protein n=1 Tax=Sphaerotilus hippei TaxID=744406 RepID=A0A318H339_9BURK|nr:GNAT family N-acetyltransferase [Sphaerotilus hippei]PXW97947.1 acetyltransferase (GNAT) family protein [Sphaerotilus hippei]
MAAALTAPGSTAAGAPDLPGLTGGQDRAWRAALCGAPGPRWMHNLPGHWELLDRTGELLAYVPPQRPPGDAEAAKALARTTYVQSPYVGWCVYPGDELHHVPEARRRWAARGLDLAGWLARRWRLPEAIVLGGTGWSTTLHAPDLAAALPAVIDTARGRWPGSVLALRNIEPDRQPDLAQAVRDTGGVLWPARVMHHYDGGQAPWQAHSAHREDLRLIRRKGLAARWTSRLPDGRHDTVLELYRQVYLERHNPLNPQYTRQWLDTADAHGQLAWLGLHAADDDRLLAFAAVHTRHGVMTVPMVGHDLAQPRDLGLYRQLCVHLFEAARQHGGLFNYSSGTGHFKRLRGSRPVLECTALWAPERSLARAPLWRGLERLAERARGPLLAAPF